MASPWRGYLLEERHCALSALGLDYVSRKLTVKLVHFRFHCGIDFDDADPRPAVILCTSARCQSRAVGCRGQRLSQHHGRFDSESGED